MAHQEFDSLIICRAFSSQIEGLASYGVTTIESLIDAASSAQSYLEQDNADTAYIEELMSHAYNLIDALSLVKSAADSLCENLHSQVRDRILGLSDESDGDDVYEELTRALSEYDDARDDVADACKSLVEAQIDVARDQLSRGNRSSAEAELDQIAESLASLDASQYLLKCAMTKIASEV